MVANVRIVVTDERLKRVLFASTRLSSHSLGIVIIILIDNKIKVQIKIVNVP